MPNLATTDDAAIATQTAGDTLPEDFNCGDPQCLLCNPTTALNAQSAKPKFSPRVGDSVVFTAAGGNRFGAHFVPGSTILVTEVGEDACVDARGVSSTHGDLVDQFVAIEDISPLPANENTQSGIVDAVWEPIQGTEALQDLLGPQTPLESPISFVSPGTFFETLHVPVEEAARFSRALVGVSMGDAEVAGVLRGFGFDVYIKLDAGATDLTVNEAFAAALLIGARDHEQMMAVFSGDLDEVAETFACYAELMDGLLAKLDIKLADFSSAFGPNNLLSSTSFIPVGPGYRA